MSTYGFISLGLIGGSIARAIREKQPEAVIVAYNRSPEALTEALNDGVVNKPVYQSSIDAGDFSAFSGCDIVFLCAPVQKNEEFLEKLSAVLPDSCIITDVGSVKTGIHEAAKRLGICSHFIGGHPMTGSERVGYANSKASILVNAYYILTPTDEVPSDMVSRYKALVESFGSLALILSYEQHDYVVAAISHLPHVISASLVNLVKSSDSEDGIMKMVAAGGFKDITRISSSSANMWKQICLTNTDNIRKLLHDYIDSLTKIDKELEQKNGDNLYNFFDGAREYRDSFSSAGSGPIKISYDLTVEISDQPGTIAIVATLLAAAGINIKNIGITHNREEQSGDLKIEFWDKAALDKAFEVLNSKNYILNVKN